MADAAEQIKGLWKVCGDQAKALDLYRAELAELRVLLDGQSKAFEQLTEKTAKLAFMLRTAIDEAAADVKKERDVNALQTEAITALIFLGEVGFEPYGGSTPATAEFYENLWNRLPALRNELNPDMRQASAEAAAGAPSALDS